MKRIWIVRGTTGEHADRRFWEVAAFETLEEAEKLEHELNAWCRDNGVTPKAMTLKKTALAHNERFDRWCEKRRQLEGKSPSIDHDFDFDVNGTVYTCVSVRWGR